MHKPTKTSTTAYIYIYICTVGRVHLSRLALPAKVHIVQKMRLVSNTCLRMNLTTLAQEMHGRGQLQYINNVYNISDVPPYPLHMHSPPKLVGCMHMP